MRFIESIARHRSQQRALLAANFYNAETLMGVLRAAKSLQAEVILQTSPSTIDYLGGVPLAVGMARGASRELGVTAWLHLDHATDPKLIETCIREGYDSVMIDASESDFATNVKRTREIVTLAHAKGVAVEAELGYVPKLGQADVTEAGLTTPEDATRFVAETGVDLLAVAIGTAHGFYKKAPKLDYERLSAIRAAVDVPLVLHGGSGLDPEQWREAIRRGIVKINFATEIKDTFTRSVKKSLGASSEIDLRKTFSPAIEAVTELVAAKISICQMTGAAV
ncbi:MAG TPA: class II fructose-bisphosphate aldolase [Planctomycetota bacterium]|nr:class II fructose-bisphosphate aldolase [Planctomycetota bacterium]